MKIFRCTVCGYIHEGDAPPEKCPNCSSPKEKFVEEHKKTNHMFIFSGEKITYAEDVQVNPFFGDYSSIAPFIYNLPPLKGVKRHKHQTSDELFFIIKGKIKFIIGENEFVAEKGDVLQAKMGTPHSFDNLSNEPAVFLSVKGPKPITTEFV